MRARFLLVGILGLLVAACGDEVDDRPLTTEYITVAILAPSCGTVSCHSTAAKTEDLVLDTIEGVQEAIDDELIVPGRPELSTVLLYMKGIDEQMPPEGPLPDKNIELVERWIESMPEAD
jgi:hypothetical protein